MSNNKMREALEAVYECAKDGVLTIRESAFKKVLEALGEPIRNCDVGTAEEQAKRLKKICYTQDRCVDCPLFKEGDNICDCYLRWSQMPYESEVAND